ncbi:hypothetical protein BGZ96_000280 [Linnemannia gamsii]|uniref:Blue (type 1) copper domain-containing protein n=1 Tax=Linnemannia gamsii TaxID=64522 RepID=A0ABQ7KBD8_9FUNG|nr:hypothetical protein BGZ96_000280 [Linnemannia gamsii]
MLVYTFFTTIVSALTLSLVAAKTVTVTVTNFKFNPAQLTISRGDTVNWVFVDGGHNVVPGVNCQAGTMVLHPALSTPGEKFQYQFNQAGTFPYFCHPHCLPFNMKASITVK